MELVGPVGDVVLGAYGPLSVLEDLEEVEGVELPAAAEGIAEPDGDLVAVRRDQVQRPRRTVEDHARGGFGVIRNLQAGRQVVASA